MAQDPLQKADVNINREEDYVLIQDFNQLDIQSKFELIIDIYGYTAFKEDENRITEFITVAIQNSKNWRNLPKDYLEEWFRYQAGFWFNDPVLQWYQEKKEKKKIHQY